MTDYKEIPVLFGPDRSLVGIITTPDVEPMAPVACLMLNMGANHRIGPRRINVKLARRMAEQGISSIRLDLAGLGDSGTASGSEHFLTQAVHDLQSAMSLIETMLGIRRFIVIGLCSGATNGLSVAVADSRVVGLLMFDGYAFPGRRSRFERSVRRALAVPTNPAVIGKTVRWLHRKISTRASSAAAPQIFEPTSPGETAATFRRSMAHIAERDVAVLFVYTGTMHVTDRHRDQLGPFAKEQFAQRFDYKFIAEIDHSLTSMASQQTFMQVVCEWASHVAQGGQSQAAAASKGGRLPGSSSFSRSLSPRVQGDTVF